MATYKFDNYMPLPTATINITTNGTYDVLTKASAVVAVPQPSGSTTLTVNGTYDVTQYATAIVAIPTYDGSIS